MTRLEPLRIDQYTPCVSSRDAVSTEVLHMQSLLQSWGYHSQIYTEIPSLGYPSVEEHTDSDIVIYHMAVGSTLPYIWANKARVKVLRYHNVTPSHFFAIESAEAFACTRAGWQHGFVEAAADVIWCDSNWNQRDFQKKSKVFSVLRHYELLPSHKQPLVRKPWFLTVGHYKPHKGHVDLLFLCALWKKVMKMPIQMIWVGAWSQSPWSRQLESIATSLELTYAFGADSHADICIYSGLSDAELAELYQKSTAYISMSRHEGVGLPLLEAAHFGLPILALECGGVRETVTDLKHVHMFSRPDDPLWILRMEECLHQKARLAQGLPRRFQWSTLEQEFRGSVEESIAFLE